MCVLAAVLARRKLSTGGPSAAKTARDLGKASYLSSVSGIIVVSVAVIIVFISLVSRYFIKFIRTERLLHKV